MQSFPVSPSKLPITLFSTVLVVGAATGCSEVPSTEGGETTGDATSDGNGDGDPSGDGDGDATGDGDGEPQALGPTYWQDVAPIFYERCVTCHQDSGIGPFSLDGYEASVALASVAVEAVVDRSMPPWFVTTDGSCNEWQDSTALSDEQIDTIVAWVEAGTPEGEPRDDLEVPVPESIGPALSATTPEIVPEAAGDLLTMNDEYRCFVLDPGIEQDGFVTASSVEPGNPALVHHVLGVIVDPDEVNDEGLTNLEAITALDAESPDRPGWPCLTLFGEGLEPKAIPIVWAPGQGVTELPEGTGVAVEAGDLMVAQIHYNLYDPNLDGQSDSTTLNLRVVDEVERVGVYNIHLGLISTFFQGEPHIIPPGEEAYEYTFDIPLAGYLNALGEGAQLWGYFPHAHERGVSMSARIVDSEGQEKACVAEVPRWDYDWQLYYFMQEPITFEQGDRLEMTCIYDTSEDAQPTIPGWGTQDEMCFMGLYLSEGP